MDKVGTATVGLRCSVAALVFGFSSYATTAPLGTAFTYQGQLKESSQPANGLYDLQVCLFDTPSNPIPLACAPDFGEVPVEAGIFTIALDFNSTPFDGEQRYMELRVRPGASVSAYTILVPRQLIRPAPEALRAATASVAPWSGLTGVPAGFADSVDNDSGGTVTSIATGTGLTGGPITGAGTVGIANAGVGLSQIAGDAIDSSRIVDGSIEAADIDAAAIQRRVSGSCVAGQYVRVINQDGTVACEADSNGGGTVTSVGTGAGLTGGPITGAGTVAIANSGVASAMIAPGAVGATQIDATQVQRRVTTACPTDQYLRSISESGVATCGPIVPPPPPPPTQGSNTNTVISTTTGVLSDVAIGQDGLPLIALANATANPQTITLVKCQNASCTSRLESTLQNFSIHGSARRIGLTVLTDGRPVIVLGRPLGISYLICSSSPICGALQNSNASTTDGFTSVDVILADDGFPLIAGITDGGQVKTIKCLSEYCDLRNQVTHTNGAAFAAGGEISLSSAPGLSPAVAYRATGAEAAKMFRCTDAACTLPASSIMTYAAGLFVGQNPSIALPSDGRPIIAHYDGQNFDLLVTRCGDASCSIGNSTQIVHGVGTVGYSPAIVLAQGFPVIAYVETSTPRVLVARCSLLDCSANTGFSIVQTLTDFSGMIGVTLSPEERPIITYTGRVIRCASVGCG